MADLANSGEFVNLENVRFGQQAGKLIEIENVCFLRSGRSGKLKAAKSTIIELDYLTAQAIQDLKLLVEKTWREANTALEEYNGLKSSLALANENIHLRDAAYAQGLSTSLEVVDAKLFLASVKIQRQAAAYEYVLSLARLLALSDQMTSFSNYQ